MLRDAFTFLALQLAVVTAVAAWFVSSDYDVTWWLYVGGGLLGLVLLFWLSASLSSAGFLELVLLLAAFAVTEGIFFGAVAEGLGIEPVLSAVGVAGIVAGMMAVLGYLDPRDMAGLVPALVLALIALLLLAIASVFIEFEGFDLVWAGLALALFSLFTVYDANQIRHRAAEQTTDEQLGRLAIRSSLDIYLDLSGLAVEVLRLRE